MNRTLLTNLLFFLLVFGSQAQTSVLKYVDPFIGTTNYGATNPGAVLPAGMVSVTPFNVTKTDLNVRNKDDGWWSTPYWHDNKVITGFSHVNLSGVGCPDMASIQLMPTTGALDVDHANYGSTYENDIASPGYYSVDLQKHKTKAEVTTTLRSGRSRYTFPAGESHVLLNLGLGLTNESGAHVRFVSNTEVEGFKLNGTFCYNQPQSVFPVYFVVRMLTEPTRSGHWKKHPKQPGLRDDWDPYSGKYKIYDRYKGEMAGENLGVYFTFDTHEGESVEVQVGISYVSIENARENLDKEQGNQSFDQIRDAAETIWSERLSQIAVEGGTEDQKTMFYTAFYHTQISPSILNDVNGQYPKMMSNEIGTTEGTRYTLFSMWDTYRNLHPLKSLLTPADQEGMVRSLLGMYQEGGFLPKWEFAANEFNVMEGDPASIIIGDTYLRGLTDFDTELAWEAMNKNANTPDAESGIRHDNDFYLMNHFIPLRKDFDNSVSEALELYISDFTIGEFGKALQKDGAEVFTKRALGYRKYFDEKYGLLRPLRPDGTFFEPFDPLMGENFEPAHGFHEGTSWNYSFSVPQDIRGLIKLHGSEKAFKERLIQCFEDSLFDMSNEPDMGYPYWFNYLEGEEWRSQQYVRSCIDTFFSTESGGLPGNDDVGTMSAWLMFSMMGFYPSSPGVPEYTFTTPVFSKVHIQLDTDYYEKGELVIESRVKDGKYIKSIKAGQKQLDGYFLSHQDLVNAGSIVIR